MRHSSGFKKTFMVLVAVLGGAAIFVFAYSVMRDELPVNDKNTETAGESKAVTENDVRRELEYLAQQNKGSSGSVTAEGVAQQLQGLAQDNLASKPSQEDIRMQLNASKQ